MMSSDHETETDAPALPKLYRELADWYPLLTPVGDYVEEAAIYRRLFETHCERPPRTLLDLGSGGGHNAAHLKAALECTLVDVSADMLAISRRLNPECRHTKGDMRTVRLGHRFDCVLVHDAVSYMTTRDDLAAAITTAFEHTEPGGAALFHPDCVAETFEPGLDTGGSDGEKRALRYLEWRWSPDPSGSTYFNDHAYMLRDERGDVEVLHDRHVMGLFPRGQWLELIESAGFEALAVPFEHSAYAATGNEVFIGLRR